MNVLITGAFGNIGEKTIKEVLSLKHKVRAFDIPTVNNKNKARRWKGQIEVIWGDIRNKKDIGTAITGQDIVIHLAFIIPPLTEMKPEFTQAVNINGTANLISEAKKITPFQKIIFASSVSVFGKTQHLTPPRTSSDAIYSTDNYTSHKIKCESLIKNSGLDYVILRFSAAPFLKFDPLFFEIPLNNRIEFVHPAAVGEAVANTISSDDVWGKTLLIGGGKGFQVRMGDFLSEAFSRLGLDMLPDKAFGNTPYYTDWIETMESEKLLHYQNYSYNDMLDDLVSSLGMKRFFIRPLKHFIRRFLISKSPYYKEN